MTLNQAKQLCRDKNGRLPRCGYEVLIASGREDYTFTDLDGHVKTRNVEFHTYLQNESGRYRVWTWHGV